MFNQIFKKDSQCMIYPPKEDDSEIKLKRTPEEQEKAEKSRRISVKEAGGWSVMDGFGLRYITPYALAVGANNFQIGLLSALPSLFGNISQLFTMKAMRKWPRKNIVFTGVLLQAIMWLFLILAGTSYFIFNNTKYPGYLVISIYTLLVFVGGFAGPAWTSWMKDLVTENRGDYFGKRSRIAGIVSIIAMLIAGFVLDYFKHTYIFIGFIVIFFIAFLGRLISGMLMLKQWEPKFEAEDKYYFTFLQFMKRMYSNNFGKFTLYFSLIAFAVAISGPFFAVYELKTLGFTYVQYMIAMLSVSISSMIFMPAWGKFTDKYGNLKVMRITGAMLPIIPLLWLATPFIGDKNLVVAAIVLFEAYSGFVWAGFNLAAGNFIFDAVSRQRLAICVSYFNMLAGVGALMGSLLGGWIAALNFSFFGLTPILFLFLISGVLRMLIHISISHQIKEVRNVKPFEVKDAKEKLKNLSLKKFFEYLDIKIIPHSSHSS